ncbi:MAG: flagellar hook basal-body protein [Rickettsiaceae bacterium]|nr:flagellar hook basal-body protein [Rickettsiaceae bacterium]
MKFKSVALALYLTFFSSAAIANNAFYISISSQVARKQDLEVITNNASNINTNGYEEDTMLFKDVNITKKSKKNNSFVTTHSIYKQSELGPLRSTGNPLDVAILEKDHYFKLMTPKGPRFTLAASMLKNSDGILVNPEGIPFMSINNDLIQVPQDATYIKVMDNGTIIADDQEIDRIGVVYIPDKNMLLKEGGSIYKNNGSEFAVDEYTVLSGYLRASNVNSARVMAESIESQRSYSGATSLVFEISDLEKKAVGSILKP